MSDSERETKVIQLSAIPTLVELYKNSDLKTPASDDVRYKANTSLLERVSLFQGDITQLKIDSIVNAANKSLLGGGGVDGAIHHAAGPHLLEECRTLHGCETGNSKITRGYALPARHVIHTVGPIYSLSNHEARAKQLASCYRTSLEVAVENGARHIAFPSVSTGIYGYPIEAATHIALDEVRRFLELEIGHKLERIIFVVWSNKDLGVYQSLIPEYFPPSSDKPDQVSPQISSSTIHPKWTGLNRKRPLKVETGQIENKNDESSQEAQKEDENKAERNEQ